MDNTKRTDWAALRALNTDRAQVAVLGAAAPPVTTTPAERAAHVRHASIESVLVSAGLTLPPAFYAEIEAHIAHEIEQALVASFTTAAGGVNWTVEARASLATDWLDHFVSSKLDTPFFTREMDEVRTFLVEQLQAAIATDRAERTALCAELSELRAAVRAWHAGAPSWNAEDDLYREMLQLAGVESATPAGPPVTPAGAGLDVERLVRLCIAMAHCTPVDDDLVAAYDAATGDGFDNGPRAESAGIRAMVLAALGIDPTTTTRGAAAQQPNGSEARDGE